MVHDLGTVLDWQRAPPDNSKPAVSRVPVLRRAACATRARRAQDRDLV